VQCLSTISSVHCCNSLNLQATRSPHQQQLSSQRPLPIHHDLLHANLQPGMPPNLQDTLPNILVRPAILPLSSGVTHCSRPCTPSHPVLQEVEMSRDPISGRGLTTPAYRVQREHPKPNRPAFGWCESHCVVGPSSGLWHERTHVD
jgi:hypothetical protein